VVDFHSFALIFSIYLGLLSYQLGFGLFFFMMILPHKLNPKFNQFSKFEFLLLDFLRLVVLSNKKNQLRHLI